MHKLQLQFKRISFGNSINCILNCKFAESDILVILIKTVEILPVNGKWRCGQFLKCIIDCCWQSIKLLLLPNTNPFSCKFFHILRTSFVHCIFLFCLSFEQLKKSFLKVGGIRWSLFYSLIK